MGRNDEEGLGPGEAFGGAEAFEADVGCVVGHAGFDGWAVGDLEASAVVAQGDDPLGAVGFDVDAIDGRGSAACAEFVVFGVGKGAGLSLSFQYVTVEVGGGVGFTVDISDCLTFMSARP